MDRLQLYLEFMLWAQLHISTVRPSTGTLGPAYRIIWRENAFLNVTGQLSELCSLVTYFNILCTNVWCAQDRTLSNDE